MSWCRERGYEPLPAAPVAVAAYLAARAESVKPATVRLDAAACETAGLGRGYTGHSLRVGAAQALAGANISLAAIMENGRWQSPRMPARYTRHAAAAQSAMAKLYGRNGQ